MSNEFLQRSSVCHSTKDIQVKAFELYDEDINQIKKLLNLIEKQYFIKQDIQEIIIDNNFPYIAGSIMYLEKICGRTTQLTNFFNLLSEMQ